MHAVWKSATWTALLLAASGCSTIHFNNGDVTPGQLPTYTQWHHNAVWQLIEVSAPVDMSQQCPDGQWVRITTELSFIGGLANTLTSGLWTPWTVAYICAEPASS